MKVAALLLVGGATMATAQAQSEGTHVEFLPMPNTLPRVFFAPNSLAGAMLEPLTGPETAVDTTAAIEDSIAGPEEMSPEAPLGPDIVAQTDPEPMEEDAAEADGAIEPETAAAEPDAPAEPEAPAAAPTTRVHVIVENVESSTGTINVAVCDTDFTPEGCPYKASVPASAGFVEAMFEDVPPGVYAVVGYHDVNDNDEFDKFLGVPREPYALSGGAAEELVPEFNDAVLKVNQGDNYVIIRMRRLGSG